MHVKLNQRVRVCGTGFNADCVVKFIALDGPRANLGEVVVTREDTGRDYWVPMSWCTPI